MIHHEAPARSVDNQLKKLIQIQDYSDLLGELIKFLNHQQRTAICSRNMPIPDIAYMLSDSIDEHMFDETTMEHHTTTDEYQTACVETQYLFNQTVEVLHSKYHSEVLH